MWITITRSAHLVHNEIGMHAWLVTVCLMGRRITHIVPTRLHAVCMATSALQYVTGLSDYCRDIVLTTPTETNVERLK